ncbi:MAG: quinone oxidoreductase [Pseudomonadales bacterium]|jgi:NADPH2:quinone reductase|nr:quinone oxidoreductase [Pseudomonadales bacterium]
MSQAPHRAILISHNGGPEVLQMTEQDSRKPRADEVRVRVLASGVNFVDIYQRTGLYQAPLPYVPGGEMCGVVEALGKNVSEFSVGELVASATAGSGCYAEVVNVAADRLVKVPRGLEPRTVAGMMLKGLTAHYLLRQVYRVGAEDTILIHAAAGGVGQIMVQWAKALGATVIGTVGSAGKAKLARALGCDLVIDYSRQDFVKAVKKFTQGEGVPVVYDSVGAATFPASLDCLQRFGLFVSFGNASGPVPPFSPALLAQKGSLFMTRPTLFDFVRTPAQLRAAASELFKVVKQGKVRVTVSEAYPLADAARAQADLEARRTTGSIVLVP